MSDFVWVCVVLSLNESFFFDNFGFRGGFKYCVIFIFINIIFLFKGDILWCNIVYLKSVYFIGGSCIEGVCGWIDVLDLVKLWVYVCDRN